MQFGRSLTTRCLDKVHQRAVRRSISFSFSTHPNSNTPLRTDTELAARVTTYHKSAKNLDQVPSRAFLSTATCLAFEATSGNQKRYRPWRPKFRKIPSDQRGLSPAQQADQGVERFTEPESSVPRPAQGDIEFVFDFADSFGIRKGSVQAERGTRRTSTRSSPNSDPSEDVVRVEEPRKTLVETYVPLSEATTAALEEELQWIARNEPNPAAIKTILTILIHDRQIKPGPQHYGALILANCDPEEGSAEAVKIILEEMEIEGVDIDAEIYTAALNVLAIHPCLPLTWSVLSALQTRWISQTPSMTYALILIFVRTSQLELANDLLNELHKANKPLPRNQRTPVPKYLYIFLIRALVENKDYEAVMRWLYRLHDRRAMEMNMPAHFWGWVLEHAARDGDGWVTGWLWQDWVEKMKLRPQRETCFDVMQIAARDGVAWLAESVRDVICHGGFLEASGLETVMNEDWAENDSDNPIAATRTLQSQQIAAMKDYIHRAETSSSHDAGYDENNHSIRAYLRLRQAKFKRRAKQDKSADTTDKTCLSEEEQSLLDQSYRNSETNLSKKRGFRGLTNLTVQKDDLEGEKRDETNTITSSSTEKARRTQVKPGNLWPWFKNIEGYGNPRFDPWKALGPKSKS